jgi:hypothetical protein
METPYELNMKWLVLDMYPILTDTNSITLALWYPWAVKCWDYDYNNNIFKRSEDDYHLLKSILNTYGQSINSQLAEYLIEFVLKLGMGFWSSGLPNPIAYETIRILYNRGNLNKIKELINNPNPGERLQTIWHAVEINDSIVRSFLISRLDKETDSVVKRELELWLKKKK